MLQIQDVGKVHGNGKRALSGISLDLRAGEILAIVGGSGCGKTTLLRLIAGLDAPTEGRILVDGDRIKTPHPAVGLVFQEPRLLPWLNVAQNVGFGLADLDAATRNARVDEALIRVGLTSARDRLPKELSGGMAQRAALARALVARPRVLLLDEPFSALDAMTRAGLQDHMHDLWAYDQPTMVLVTHDIEEALVLADRVAVMKPNPGRIDTTQDVHLPRPRDRATAAFESEKRRLRAALDQSLTGEERDPALAI